MNGEKRVIIELPSLAGPYVPIQLPPPTENWDDDQDSGVSSAASSASSTPPTSKPSTPTATVRPPPSSVGSSSISSSASDGLVFDSGAACAAKYRPQSTSCDKNYNHQRHNQAEVWIFEGPQKKLVKYKVPIVRENEPVPTPAPTIEQTPAPRPEGSPQVQQALRFIQQARAKAAARLQEAYERQRVRAAEQPQQPQQPQEPQQPQQPRPLIRRHQRRIVPRPPGTKGTGRVPVWDLQEGRYTWVQPEEALNTNRYDKQVERYQHLSPLSEYYYWC